MIVHYHVEQVQGEGGISDWHPSFICDHLDVAIRTLEMTFPGEPIRDYNRNPLGTTMMAFERFDAAFTITALRFIPEARAL